MSKKHNQRTRAEILAKREAPISTWKGFAKFGVPAVIAIGRNADVRKASRSKYTPQTGAKEVERAKRLYLSYSGNRPTPTLCQISAREYAEGGGVVLF